MVKRFIYMLVTIQAVAIAGCATDNSDGYRTALDQSDEERRASNVIMVRALSDESVKNGIIRQKTLYPYHFLPDTPLLTEIGERDLAILATYYRTKVLPYLSKTVNLKEVKLYFDYDDARIRSDAVPPLEEAIRLLAENPNADLIITGHADARGSNEYNDVLSAQRAGAVKRYMSEHAVAENRVRIVSRGEMDAMASEADFEGMQADRNAHFMVAEMQDYPVDLNVRRGGVSKELYSARRRTVRTYLARNGVDTNLITLSDGTAGGDGLASETVLLILTDTTDFGSGGIATSGGN